MKDWAKVGYEGPLKSKNGDKVSDYSVRGIGCSREEYGELNSVYLY